MLTCYGPKQPFIKLLHLNNHSRCISPVVGDFISFADIFGTLSREKPSRLHRNERLICVAFVPLLANHQRLFSFFLRQPSYNRRKENFTYLDMRFIVGEAFCNNWAEEISFSLRDIVSSEKRLPPWDDGDEKVEIRYSMVLVGDNEPKLRN